MWNGKYWKDIFMQFPGQTGEVQQTVSLKDSFKRFIRAILWVSLQKAGKRKGSYVY